MQTRSRPLFSVDDILMDPLIKDLPAPPHRALVSRVLKDPTLTEMNLDLLTEMDFEDIVHNLYVDSGHHQEPDRPTPAAAGSCPITIDLDSLAVRAVITLRQIPGCGAPTVDDIRRALQDRGVTEGIREEFILRLVEHPIYDKRFRIAEGIVPVNGSDGSAVFHFDTDKSLSLDPSAQEVDFQDMDFAEYVHQGTLLCELTSPTPGLPGRSVMGDILPGAQGAPSPVRAGTNAILSEDGTKIYAACDGHVFLKNNRVGVSRVMVLDDVDQSTGNILFVGSVLVRGDVEDGRLVQAGGNITVCGHVKNAKLFAGRNLILINGITGSDDALITAEGSIRARFLENARVKVAGDLFCDSALNAQIDCGGSVYLLGKRGRLVGGHCQAAQSITAKEIGNRASIRTTAMLKQADSSSALLEAQAHLTKLHTIHGLLENMAKSITYMEQPQPEHIAALLRAVCILHRLDDVIAQQQALLDGKAGGPLSTAHITATECLYSDVHLGIYGTVLDTTTELGPCSVTYGGPRLIVSGIASAAPRDPGPGGTGKE